MRHEWEIEVIHEPSGEYMTVYLGDDEDYTIEEIADIIFNDISIVPRKIND